MTIVEIAWRYGVSVGDILTYEREGLLNPRREDGHAAYCDRECLRIEVILRAEQLGISHAALKMIIDAVGR